VRYLEINAFAAFKKLPIALFAGMFVVIGIDAVTCVDI
jgi:hypothetical protein